MLQGLMLLTSPHVNLDLHPDVRKGLLSRRTFRTFQKRAISAELRRSVIEAGR